MKRTAIPTLVITFGLAFVATGAKAGGAVSYVSGHGNDSYSCTFVQPCRTFYRAQNVTNSGGQITVLDAASYGSITITKALSIVDGSADGGGVTMIGAGTAIAVSAGANDAVALRGLTIEGSGVGINGILFNSGKSLTVKNCVVRNFRGSSGAGILFAPNATSSLSVSDTVASDNATAGIWVHPSGSGTVSAVFNHVEAKNNNIYGFDLDGSGGSATIQATASESVASGNSIGFYAQAASRSSPATFMLDHVVAANNNSTGVEVSGIGTTARLYQSMVTGSDAGWVAASGTVQSYSNNSIDGNAGNETAPTAISLK